VRDHGLEYLLAATILAGVVQVLAGLCRLGSVMRFVSRSVKTGFVNALAIMIFMAQLPELTGMPWQTYAMIAAGFAITYLFPRLTKAIPSPLVCITVLTALTVYLGHRRAHRGRSRSPTRQPASVLDPQYPIHLRDALDYPAVLDQRCRRGSAGEPPYGRHRRSDDRHRQ